MKIPLTWLAAYTQLKADIPTIAAQLTTIGHMLEKPPITVADDTVLDLEIRQNRSDCLSVLGIAREYAAITGQSYTEPVGISPLQLPDSRRKEFLHIEIAPDAPCRRFIGIRIDNINQNAQIPSWMRARLTHYGMSCINPLVDITNYVMIELGQPLHVFDANLVGNHLKIRNAHAGETCTALGGNTYTLTEEDCIVAQGDTPLALAGVVGGAKSGVHAETTSVILEAATYRQSAIRRTSNRHSIRTEASTRHEKFLHPDLAVAGISRALHLIYEICGGTVVATCDVYPKHEVHPVISAKPEDVARLTGIAPTDREVQQVLGSLGFQEVAPHQYRAPYWRTDIQETADLVEEYIRIFGYENIPSTIPHYAPPTHIIDSIELAQEESIRDIFVQLGYDEQITEPFVDASEHCINTHDHMIILENSLNAQKNTLRSDLITTLMRSYRTHQKYRVSPICIFEVGKIYTKHTVAPQYQESRAIAYIYSQQDISDDATKRSELYQTALAPLVYLRVPLATCSIVWIDHCTIGVQFPLSAIPQKINAPRRLITHIPSYHYRDISCILPTTTALDTLCEYLRMQTGVVHLDIGEIPQVKPDGVYILITSVLEDVATYDILVNILQTRYEAKLR